jgi:mannose-6-phosphate isomerase-like protein (cupin superfamily)
MPDVTVKRLEEFEAIFGGGFLRVRAGLGVSSFGLAVMNLPSNFKDYPEHNQAHDHQEEVYAVIRGRATLVVGEATYDLEPGVWARVGEGEQRKIVTGDEPAQVLAIGGSPGAVYKPPEFTEEGAPDPLGGRKHEIASYVPPGGNGTAA